MKIIPQTAIPETDLLEKEFKEVFGRVRCSWRSSRTEIEEILTNHAGLKKGSYRKSNIPIWINYMDEYVASDGNNPVLFDKFDKFTISGIERATKKNYEPPRHRFFELGEALKEKQEDLYRAFDQHLIGLKITLFDYVQKELAKRKQRQNIQSFDDLLMKLRIALEGERGEELARAIRTRYRAALIDEFQDTDPIQYAIFKNVFRNDNQILFLIGDPKQAIYSFRSADIFAYLDAVSYVDSEYTLGENWRSNPDLINAINTLFSNKGTPFVYDEIPFKPAVAAKTRSQEFLTINGKAVPAFLLWFLDAGKVDVSRLTTDKRFIKKSADTRKLIAMTVGTEISRLLSLGKENKVLIGKSSIKEGDIAVLVRTNREASLMQEVLADLKIPSVLYSTGNLFDSHEAVEMERVLGGIAEPNNERLIKTALTTDILGVRGEELGGLTGNEAEWGMWLRKFSDYHEMWCKHNFIRMFRYFMLKERVRNRLLLFNDGERRLTNLLHLSEVLHQEAIERKLSLTGLLKWFSEQRNPDLPRLEEHQLRLESDEYAVKVVTIHKSKGLEYLVVFCPFLWDGSKLRGSKDHFIFHDEDDNRKLTMDLGSERGDENRALAEREILAENLRLLYVALTRAKSRCYIVWGHFNEAGTSALTYLFHHPGRLEAEKIVDAIESIFQELT
ncbi:MAG: UvrD-helicase domain-containing protein, partial [Deltaproteobacteria bacterium]|nr:UvrD-helicase domain-containing protein [Deltaproteobacteria bacterium]